MLSKGGASRAGVFLTPLWALRLHFLPPGLNLDTSPFGPDPPFKVPLPSPLLPEGWGGGAPIWDLGREGNGSGEDTFLCVYRESTV